MLPKLSLYIPYEDYRHHTPVDPNQKIRTRDASTPNSINTLVFHCTDADKWSPQRLGQFFVDERHFPICGYHFYVQAEKVWHMVSENVITYHAAPWNTKSVAFSIDYPATFYERTNVKLDQKIYDNAVQLAALLCIRFHILPVSGKLVGHRELPVTGWFKDKQDIIHLRKICPGMAINLDVFRYNTTRSIQILLGLTVDGIVGPKTKLAINNAESFEWL